MLLASEAQVPIVDCVHKAKNFRCFCSLGHKLPTKQIECGDFDATAVFIDVLVCVQCFDVHAVNMGSKQSTAGAKNESVVDLPKAKIKSKKLPKDNKSKGVK